MNNLQKIGVTGFIRVDTKVLILKRSDMESFLPGYYELPGGKVEFSETAEEALKREIKEETGLSVEVIKPYATFSYLTANDSKHTIDIQYICRLVDNINNIKFSKEHSSYALIEDNEINEYKISDLMRNAILKGFLEKQIK